MTFGDMQAYVLDRLGISTSDTVLVTDIKLYLNTVVAELVARYGLKTGEAALTLTSGDPLASLPADWQRTLSIIRGGVTLQPVTTEELGAYRAAALTADGPLYYEQASGTQIRVVPTPDAAAAAAGATLLYVQSPATLVNSGDVASDVPAPYHPLVCERVVAMMAEEEGDPQVAALAEARAERLEDRLRGFLAQRVGPGSQDIPLKHYRRP